MTNSRTGEAENNLHDDSDLLYRSLVENAVLGVYSSSHDGKFLHINSAMVEMLGYETKEELLAVNVKSLCAIPEERDKMLAGLPQSDAVNGLDVTWLRRDGTHIKVHVSGKIIRDQSGDVRRFEMIAEDVTERVRAREAEIKARVAAEAAVDAKSAFLAAMSHEIRTPLNGVVGMVELLLDTELDPEQREVAEVVGESADALLEIINNILDFSKLEAGEVVLEDVAFNPHRVVASVTRLFVSRAFEKGVELAHDVPDDIPTAVHGDPGRVRQVLNNLVNNALKFTESGEVVVALRLLEENDSEMKILFSVRDSGIGIPEEVLPLIFDHFSQADTSTTRKYGGTGLGLAISQKIVSHMGGSLSVESEVGKGSVFSWELSLKRAIATEPRIEKPDLRQLGASRILVVDDNGTNRRILRGMLAPIRADVVDVEGASPAWKALEDASRDGQAFDLAIIDGHMPDRDGFDLAASIKSEPSLAETKLMILTSGGRAGDGQRCREIGISAYLSKPVNRLELLDAIAAMYATGEKAVEPKLVTKHSIAETRSSLTILLAEDNPVNQKVAGRILSKRGHEVVIVENGELAVEAVEGRDFDVVLMDVEMPVMDGITAMRKIIELNKEPQPRMFALTAHATLEQRQKIMSEGFEGFIPKPFKPHELFLAIETENAIPPEERGELLSESEPAGLEELLKELQEAGIEIALGGILSAFVADIEPRLMALDDALAAGDAEAMRVGAHAMKSSAGAVKAVYLMNALERLEKKAAAGEMGEAPAMVIEIKKISADVEEQINSFRDQLANL